MSEGRKLPPQRENSHEKTYKRVPVSGRPLAEKTTEAFDAKKLTASFSTFKSFQSIMVEHAKLMSWLWGGAAAVGVIAYAIGKSRKRDSAIS